MRFSFKVLTFKHVFIFYETFLNYRLTYNVLFISYLTLCIFIFDILYFVVLGFFIITSLLFPCRTVEVRRMEYTLIIGSSFPLFTMSFFFDFSNTDFIECLN